MNSMEHIITPIAEGYLRLTPEAGYILVNTISNRHYSEAEVKESKVNNFKVEKI